MGTPVCTYDPSRTYIVDKTATNYLVRGNMPLADDGTIAYDQLKTKMLELGVDMTGMKLLIISLIDNQGELNDLELEFAGLGEPNIVGNLAWPPFLNGVDCTEQYGTIINGVSNQHGSIMWFPVQGCIDNANCQLVEPSQYDFGGLVVELSTLLITCLDTIIYYHCEHGHDRTSALTAAYQMEALDYPLEQVLTERPPNGAKAFSHAWECNYEALVKWYATTLKPQ